MHTIWSCLSKQTGGFLVCNGLFELLLGLLGFFHLSDNQLAIRSTHLECTYCAASRHREDVFRLYGYAGMVNVCEVLRERDAC